MEMAERRGGEKGADEGEGRESKMPTEAESGSVAADARLRIECKMMDGFRLKRGGRWLWPRRRMTGWRAGWLAG